MQIGRFRLAVWRALLAHFSQPTPRNSDVLFQPDEFAVEHENLNNDLHPGSFVQAGQLAQLHLPRDGVVEHLGFALFDHLRIERPALIRIKSGAHD